jgi:dTDP-glucose pyrophosphorylase/CBS domain-containing protein
MRQRVRTDWQRISVLPEATLRDAMLAIDQGRIGIALVVDTEGRLLGTVTDGDLRRAILRRVDLDAAVSLVMNRNYTAANQDTTEASVLALMHGQSVKQVPLLDANGAMMGVYYLSDLVESSSRPNWAVIMAGGQGRRLRPLTAKTPKPMLSVGDRPLLENLIALLVHHGFRQLFVSIYYLAEQIRAHFGDGAKFGCHITYLHEHKPLGTGGALSLLRKRPLDHFLVINGDLLTDLNLSALMDYHVESGCVATQCVREYHFQVPYGVVRCEDGQVVELTEKPLQLQLINAGIYVLSPILLDLVPADQEFTMPELLARARSKGHRVAAFPIHERWTDIGRPEDYRVARHSWVSAKVK